MKQYYNSETCGLYANVLFWEYTIGKCAHTNMAYKQVHIPGFVWVAGWDWLKSCVDVSADCFNHWG